MRRIPAGRRRAAVEVLTRLAEAHADAAIALTYATPFQLLVATILSAQCTDARVNAVTPPLFARFPRPQDYLEADQAELEELIRPTGFFRTKAKHIRAAAEIIATRHGGEVPRSMVELTALPGVGRKTANVVLGNAFGIPGMVVDTHVGRVSRRLGWTEAQAPERVEQDLMRLFKGEDWTRISHLLIFHGRRFCKAPTPHCSRCPVAERCPRCGVTRSR